jgi:cysteine desulfurase
VTNVNRIYFDNAATTRMDPRVEEAMRPYLSDRYGNPSSMHADGRQARQVLESAREQVAATLGVKANEIVFTGSGTEADNSAIIGIFRSLSGRPFHMITSKIEHPAVLEACRYIEGCGAKVTYLGAGAAGMIDADAVEKAIGPDTRLISIMAANNVTGVLQPIAEVAAVADRHGVLFHCDAVQAYGKIAIDMPRQQIDLLSLSAHKLHGPKGVGALALRDKIPFRPLLLGGGQEEGRRSATQNVAGIIGLATAAALHSAEMASEALRLAMLRNQLWDGIKNQIPAAYLIGDPERRLPGHLCVGFSGLEGDAIKLLLALDEEGIAVSSGSACSAHKSGEPSYVLQGMGFDPLRARGSLRLTLGHFNNEAEVECFLKVLPRIISALKPISTFRKNKEN